MSLPLSDVIGDFADEATVSSFTVTRQTEGSYVNGRLVAGSTSSLTIEALIQPISGRELIESLPEGQSVNETRLLYTTTLLQTRTATDNPDRVTFEGEPWTVINVEKWDAWGDVFYKVLISRREQ